MIVRTARAFAGRELRDYLAEKQAALRGEVIQENEDYLLNVGESEYVDRMVESHTIELPQLFPENWTVDQTEQEVPASAFPPGFDVRNGMTYRRVVYLFHIPYAGDVRFFEMQPSTQMGWSPDIRLEPDIIGFELVEFSEDPERLRKEAEQARDYLVQWLSWSRRDLQAFNEGLPEYVRELVRGRKSEILRRRGVAEAIGVPIRRKSNLPGAVQVPSPARKRIRPKPLAPTTPFEPEFALPDQAYKDIVDAMHQIGATWEQHPSIYLGKGEEDLRDLFLAHLVPLFEGSATGETFNKEGKTDILLRHQEKNIFVAECVVWNGPKKLLEKVDQLLSYLTWRDSKTALVVFVTQPDISRIQSAIREVLPTHANFLRFVGAASESQAEYRFHLPGDRNREVHLTVLAFHFPRPARSETQIS